LSADFTEFAVVLKGAS